MATEAKGRSLRPNLSVSLSSIDDLIDRMDQIPAMMTKLNANGPSPRRYSGTHFTRQLFRVAILNPLSSPSPPAPPIPPAVLGPNHSMQIGSAISGHSPVNDAARAERLRSQADRVLRHLSDVTEPAAARQLQLHEAAEHAAQSLEALARKQVLTDRGGEAPLGLRGLYGQYDRDRRGRITYDDFCDSLQMTTAGINRAQGRLLASEMDKHKVRCSLGPHV